MELASYCTRVVTSLLVPADLSFEALLLADLHAEHLGMVKMKQLARKYFWWPGLDKQIEETVKLRPSCQESAKSPASAPTASWSWPGGPWKRLHVDFSGPYLGRCFWSWWMLIPNFWR